MGGLTFNIGSLGMFADMMASGIARNNATGQAGKFGEIAQKLEGKGILEINIGSNGIKGKFGMGGFDLAGSLYTFGKRMSDKAALEAYAMQEGVSQEDAEAAYWGYVYGDWTQENTMARISSRRDELHIVDDMADDANAQTVQKADGTGRVITMENTGDVHKNAITLGHEAYRDGVVTDHSSQQAETINAVLAHSAMAEKMTQYNQSLSGILALEAALYKAGRTDLLAGIAEELYDSSGDYWRFNLDGTIEDTKDRAIYREIIKENGESKYEKLEDYEGSRIEALVKTIGIENFEKMAGISSTILNFVKNLNCDESYEHILGEMYMAKYGYTYSEENDRWEGGNGKIPGLGKNDSLGVIRNSKTGKYTFFTAGIDFTREDNAFSVYKDGSIPLKDDGTVNRDWDKYKKDVYDKVANTSATFWMKDVFTGKDIARETFDNAFTSLDNVYHKNSIVSEYFNMRLIKYDPETYGVDTVGLFSNAYTAAGKAIDIGGFDGTSSKRFLYHPTSQYGTMEGCFGPMSDYGVGNSTTQNTGTSAYYFQQQLNLYNSLGIYNGYQFNIHLKGRLKP